MSSLKEVAVVMSAFNGSRHIASQLDSIIRQSYDKISIYIRDDGSTDNTLDIIKEYITRDYVVSSGRRIVFIEDSDGNLGYPGSFYRILKECEKADYYAFSDQDDYWYPEKISWAVEKLNSLSEKDINLYCSSCRYLTEKGEFIRDFICPKGKIELRHLLFSTIGPGFTVVINETAKKRLVIQVDPGKEFHDRFLERGAVCFGNIICDSRITADHIRYDNSVTANDSDNIGLLRGYLKKELFGSDANKESEYLSYFLETFDKSLNRDQRELLKYFTDNSLSARIRKVLYNHRLRSRLSGELALRFLFLTGKV